MKFAWAAAFVATLVLIGAGVLQWLGRNPQGEPIKLIPPPTPAPLVIHVAGAVTNPGVYELPQGSRVRDAIAAAGELKPDADPQQLNLAAVLVDGQRILVPEAAAVTAVVEDSTRSGNVTPLPNFPLDINSASQVELEALPDIGPKTAEKIIAYRNEHGLFSSIEEIQKVDGIGPVIYEEIKELIIVR